MKAGTRVLLLSGFLLLFNGTFLPAARASAFEKGVDAYSDGNFQDALRHFRVAAAPGYVQVGAQHNLGVMYANGEGVPRDIVRAYLWFDVAGRCGRQKP